MNAPDKIYLQACGTCPLNEEDCKRCRFEELEDVTWCADKIYDKDIEYIRKDALLGWAKDMHEAYRKKYEESNHTCGEHWGQMVAFRKMIDKLNSL